MGLLLKKSLKHPLWAFRKHKILLEFMVYKFIANYQKYHFLNKQDQIH